MPTKIIKTCNECGKLHTEIISIKEQKKRSGTYITEDSKYLCSIPCICNYIAKNNIHDFEINADNDTLDSIMASINKTKQKFLNNT